MSAARREIAGLLAIGLGVALLVISMVEVGWWSAGILIAVALCEVGLWGAFHHERLAESQSPADRERD